MKSIIGNALLLVFVPAVSYGQNFIGVSGTAFGTGGFQIFGGGASASGGVTVNQPLFPYQTDQTDADTIPGYANGLSHLGASASLINGFLSVGALCQAQVDTRCGEVGCGTGVGSGAVTGRVTFRVDAPAVLYCQTGSVIAQTAFAGVATASATAEILLASDGGGIQFRRQISANGPETTIIFNIPEGGIARLVPGVDYRIDATASASGTANGQISYVGAGLAIPSGTFHLVSNDCPTVSDPAAQTRCPTAVSTFTVAAVGAGQLNFHWQVFDSGAASWTDLADGSVSGVGTVSGSLTNTLTISSPAITANALRCVVSNACGTAYSMVTTLTICASDFNCDDIIDFFDYLDFVAEFSANGPDADFNADTVVDFFDYLDFVAAFSSGC